MFWPSFLSLAAVGLIGVAVFASTAPQTLLAQLPIEGAIRKRLLLAIQPAILTVLLAAAGAGVADAAASKSLIADVASGNDLEENWVTPIAVFLLVGITLGAFLYLIDRWWKPWWGAPDDEDLIDSWRPSNVVAGVTYGGITEEVLMRWGIMGILLWALVSIGGGSGDPGTASVLVAIVLSSLLFAAGHLPAALLGRKRSTRFVIRVLVLNTVAGLLFGWLFWEWNLETAMAAHMGFHIGAAILVLALGAGRKGPASIG